MIPRIRHPRSCVVHVAVVLTPAYIPGSGSPAFKGIGVRLGVLVSFSSTGTVTNGVAGTILTYTGAFKSGDRVKIGEAPGTILHTPTTIGYDAPWMRVHELLLAAARRTDVVRSDPGSFVLQTSLDDSYVSYQINVHTVRPERMLDICSWLHANIQDAFDEAGVEIMSPSCAARRDGNTITIPKTDRPEGDGAPGFMVDPRSPRQAAAPGTRLP